MASRSERERHAASSSGPAICANSGSGGVPAMQIIGLLVIAFVSKTAPEIVCAIYLVLCGLAALGAFVVPEGSKTARVARAGRWAAISATLWFASLVVVSFLSYGDLAGLPVSSPGYVGQWWSNTWQIELLRNPALTALAALVIALGVLLDLPDHQVVIVLVPLGIAMAILAALTRLPSGALAALVIALAVATPALTRAHGATLTSLGSPGWWYELLVVGHPYRVASMVLWGLVGALAVRALRSRRRPMLEIGGASVLVASAATLAVLSHVNRIDASPYSGTYAETALTTCLALAVLLVCRACAPVIPAVVLARLDAVGARVGDGLAANGQAAAEQLSPDALRRSLAGRRP